MKYLCKSCVKVESYRENPICSMCYYEFNLKLHYFLNGTYGSLKIKNSLTKIL